MHSAFIIRHYTSSFIWQHPRQRRRVDRRDHRRPAQPALAVPRLAAQEVLLERFAPQKLPVLGPLEALRGAPMCFEFRHVLLTLNAEPAETVEQVFSACSAVSALI